MVKLLVALAVALVSAPLLTGAAAELGNGVVAPWPASAPHVYSVPTPAPLAPPSNPGYAPPPQLNRSPLLSRGGPVDAPVPPAPRPSYPAPPLPGPVDQQKIQSYRSDLQSQQWQLQRNGVSPGTERSREVQQQLNQFGSQPR